MTRQEANIQLLQILVKAAEDYPDWRFGQILFNLGFLTRAGIGYVHDPFNEESVTTLNVVKDQVLNMAIGESN